MSTPSEADQRNDQSIQPPPSNLQNGHILDSNHHGCSQRTCPVYDEYTTLLKKHLSVVESELNRFKGEKTDDRMTPGMGDQTGTPSDTRVNGQDYEAQEAKIMRVQPWEWREVKRERMIQLHLPSLIASSKGHGRVGQMSIEQRRARRKRTPVDAISSPEEVPQIDFAYRLAINSRTLLSILGECTGMGFPEDQNVWLRPFKYLVAYETEVRQALHDAELNFDQLEAKSPHQVDMSPSQSGASNLGPDLVQAKEDKSSTKAVGLAINTSVMDAPNVKAERDQLRCLVEFMDTDMQDIFDVKRKVTNKTLQEVAFEELWLLYKPGDLVYTWKSPDDTSTYQAYRVLHVTGGRTIIDTANDSRFDAIRDRSWEDDSDTEERARDLIRSSPSNATPFIIDCFSIDFDGIRMGPKSRRFVIPSFIGKRKVDSLEICPSFSPPQPGMVHQALIDRGRRFTQLAGGTHKRYSGTTLRESKELWESTYYYWNYVIHEEEVHSEVMIDQAAAVTHYRKAYDKWRLKIGGRTIGVPTAANLREVFDPMPYEHLLTDVFDDSIIDLDRRNEFVNSSMLLRYRNILETSICDDYVMLLPFRVYGYAMLNRKWFPLKISLISDITPEQVKNTAAGYEDLVLPEGHKKLLQAVVKNQVTEPRQRSSKGEEDLDEFQMDVVKGKGKGLIILLHGAPGVGKTSTAECVAAQLKRPLLPITCGDVSTNAKDAEETLQQYCALAHRWRCVLLLDEADVFLAKREKGDVARNGLVSVFLRVLEYYSGVIILTTNRVGEFDEAFRSRIHISLYYPKLKEDATLQIWERSLLRLRKSDLEIDFSEEEIRKFAKDHWMNNEEKPSRHWNGRQIKNAFQTALALANWEFYETKQGQKLERPLLKANHFDRVAKTSAHFDDYISDIHNISEDTWSVLAARDEIRKDTHPAMAFARSQTQEFVPRSQRTTPARRGAGARNARTDEGRKAEGGGDKVRELELELELLKLKQGKGKEEAPQVGAGDEEEDEEW